MNNYTDYIFNDYVDYGKMINIRPSSLERVTECPASYMLNLNEQPSGEMATFGTKLHKAVESSDCSNLSDSEIALIEPILIELNEFKEDGWDVFREKKLFLKKEDNVLCAGTADIVLYKKETNQVAIIDLKFGFNDVEVDDNLQVKMYCAMALQEFNASSCMFGIYQPNTKKSIVFNREILLQAHVVDSIEMYVELVRTVLHYPFKKPGKHCRYCQACNYCSEALGELSVISENEVVVSYEAMLTNLETLSSIKSNIDDFIKSKKNEILEFMQNGGVVSGYELASGSKSRDLIDGKLDELYSWAVEKGLSRSEIMESCKISLRNIVEKASSLDPEKLSKMKKEMRLYDELVDKEIIEISIEKSKIKKIKA